MDSWIEEEVENREETLKRVIRNEARVISNQQALLQQAYEALKPCMSDVCEQLRSRLESDHDYSGLDSPLAQRKKQIGETLRALEEAGCK